MARKWRDPRRFPWSVAFVFVGGLLVGSAAIWLGVAKSASSSNDLWFEAAKAGTQLVAIVILGGSVTWAFRSLDARREDDRRLDEYLGATVNELWDAYHRVKAVRRTLRASGFGPLPLAEDSQLSAQQSTEFRAQMDILVDEQLLLTKLWRNVVTQPALYHPKGPQISSLLETAKGYINDVITDWERHGQDIQEGADLEQLTHLTKLQDFLALSWKGGVREYLADPVEEAAAQIQSLRFGTPERDSLGAATSEERTPT
jgi:hypothetical protein